MTVEDPASTLQARVQQFVRNFGLLRTAETPCGRPLQLSHAHALMVLLAHGTRATRVRHKDLAVALRLDKSSIARLCARMEEEGHISQRRAADDGRAREVALTAKGTKVAREVEAASRSRFGRVLAALPKAEHERVLAALEVLNDAVRSLDPENSA